MFLHSLLLITIARASTQSLDVCATVDMQRFDLTIYCSTPSALNVSVMALDYLDNRSCLSWQSGFPSALVPFARAVQECNMWKSAEELTGGRVMKLALSATDMQATCTRHCGAEQSCHAILRVGDMAWLTLIPPSANSPDVGHHDPAAVLFSGVRVLFVALFIVVPVVVAETLNKACILFRFVP